MNKAEPYYYLEAPLYVNYVRSELIRKYPLEMFNGVLSLPVLFVAISQDGTTGFLEVTAGRCRNRQCESTSCRACSTKKLIVSLGGVELPGGASCRTGDSVMLLPFKDGEFVLHDGQKIIDYTSRSYPDMRGWGDDTESARGLISKSLHRRT